jgi:hypothetical protein
MEYKFKINLLTAFQTVNRLSDMTEGGAQGATHRDSFIKKIKAAFPEIWDMEAKKDMKKEAIIILSSREYNCLLLGIYADMDKPDRWEYVKNEKGVKERTFIKGSDTRNYSDLCEIAKKYRLMPAITELIKPDVYPEFSGNLIEPSDEESEKKPDEPEKVVPPEPVTPENTEVKKPLIVRKSKPVLSGVGQD